MENPAAAANDALCLSPNSTKELVRMFERMASPSQEPAIRRTLPVENSTTPTSARGVTLDFLQQFKRIERPKGIRRMQGWSAAKWFEGSPNPVFGDDKLWSVRVTLPSGRHTWKALTGTHGCLPTYTADQGQLSKPQQEQFRSNFVSTYAVSTRAVWDEMIDPLLFEGTGGTLLSNDIKCYIDLDKVQNPSTSTANVGKANAFVSHALDNSFDDLLDALAQFVKSKDLDPTTIFFWIDGFCLAKGPTSVSAAETFQSVIAEASYFLSVLTPWDSPLPLTRCWCIWEIFCALKAEKHTHANKGEGGGEGKRGGCVFEICMPHTEEEAFVKSVQLEGPTFVLDKIRTINIAEAQAYRAQDRKMIFSAVANLRTPLQSGVGVVNTLVKEGLRQWVMATIKTGKPELRNEALQMMSAQRQAGRLPELEEGYKQAIVDELAAVQRPLTLSDTLRIYGGLKYNLADVLHKREQELEAETVLDEVLSTLTPFQTDSTITPEEAKQLSEYLCDTKELLGIVWKKLGKFDEAVLLLREVFVAKIDLYGETDPQTLSAQCNHAHAFKESGNLEKAEEALKQVELICENSNDTSEGMKSMRLKVQCFLAELNHESGKYQEGLDRLVPTLALYEEQNGADTDEFDATFMLMGLCKYGLGDYTGAKHVFETLVSKSENDVSPRAHSSVMAAKQSLAGLYFEEQNYDKALQVFSGLYVIEQKAKGDSMLASTILTNIASVHSAMGDLESAESFYRRAFTIRKQILPPNHYMTLKLQTSIANMLVYKTVPDYNAAHTLYAETLQAYKNTVGNLHPETGQAALAFGMFELRKREDCQPESSTFDVATQNAIECFTTASVAFSQTLGKNHPKTLSTQVELKKLKHVRVATAW
eukprot:m.86643 g.86643  ORF g.86643 m.86643 type:complete len:875 (+) comp25986_c0_seq2:632-3256(+)